MSKKTNKKKPLNSFYLNVRVSTLITATSICTIIKTKKDKVFPCERMYFEVSIILVDSAFYFFTSLQVFYSLQIAVVVIF